MQQISIETAQSKLDCSVLEKLPGKTIILGVLDLSDMTIETPETVAARIRRALPHVPAERIVVAPDCGLKYLPREVAFGKMQAMVDGAANRAPRALRAPEPVAARPGAEATVAWLIDYQYLNVGESRRETGKWRGETSSSWACSRHRWR